VDEYIAYVAGEYTKLEKRLNAVRAENAKIAAEKAASAAAADIPGLSPDPEELSRAHAEADAILEQARREAEELLGSAGRDAGTVREKAEAESARILGEAKEAKEAAAREADGLDGIRKNLDEERARLDALKQELADGKADLDAQILRIGEERRALEAERAALNEERLALCTEKDALSAEKEALSAGQGNVESLREEAAEQLRESERIYAGLSTAAARFRNDVLAFSSSMRSMAQSQLSAAERFGADADRFLDEVNAFSAKAPADTDPDDAGDLFGFASAAAMIGEMLKDLPEEPSEPSEPSDSSEQPGTSEEPSEPEQPERAEPAAEPEPVRESASEETGSHLTEGSETDALFAETAVSEHIAAETDRILDSIRGLTEEAFDGLVEYEMEESEELAEPEEPTESAEQAEPEEPQPQEPEEPGAFAVPSEPEPAEEPEFSSESREVSGEEPVLPDNPESGASEPEEPGDEELEAVMKALSGISEDDSYDAILEAFQPEEEVDLNLAADLEKKRRENFRRMMDAAAAEREAEKNSGKRETAQSRVTDAPARRPNPGKPAPKETEEESDLEKEIAAAVEAAVRAKLDPGQALDEVFAELSREDGNAEETLGAAEGLFSETPSELPPDMLELLDFDEPGGDSAAYTDHDLAEFAAGISRDRKEPQKEEPEDEE
jgi:hypothetical protein